MLVDLFAGGGGASLGLEQALGRQVDIAIDHGPVSIAVHRANHPGTVHRQADVWEVDPLATTGGRPVYWLHASPDCTHHSRAKGGAPRCDGRRSLAWAVVDWARKVKPRVVTLENVTEFADWGPLTADGVPDKSRAGETFREFIAALRALGYQVEHRELSACDYGAPTTRRRLFLVARCDGLPIRWPEPTHGRPGELFVVDRGKTPTWAGEMFPWRTAAECIDWSLPAPSIFDRRKPLAEATLRRIALGIKRYVIDDPAPFIAPVVATGGCNTVQAAAWIAKHYGGVVGICVERPLSTVTSVDHHSLVMAFLVRCFKTGGQWQGCDEPLHTITTKHRMGLVTVHGQDYRIVDIGMRMLQPHELAAAQGFPPGYVIDRTADGKPVTKADQVRLIGNSVAPPVMAALARVNHHEKGEGL